MTTIIHTYQVGHPDNDLKLGNKFNIQVNFHANAIFQMLHQISCKYAWNVYQSYVWAGISLKGPTDIIILKVL